MICLVTSSSCGFRSRSDVLMPLYSRKFEADWNEVAWKMVFPSLNGFLGRFNYVIWGWVGDFILNRF